MKRNFCVFTCKKDLLACFKRQANQNKMGCTSPICCFSINCVPCARCVCVCVVSERWRESCSDGDLQDQKVAMKSVKWREDWATPICDVYCDTEHAVLTWNNCSGHSNLKLRVVCSSDSLATCCCLSAAVGDDTRTWGHTSQLWIHTHAFARFSRNETIRTVHRMLSSVKTVYDLKPFRRYELSKHRPSVSCDV